ncbi:carbohydrate ABC transporter permease [Cohnella silvisoli]|uniref:Carbohydrate ABC transporter permease n=1 Tax=Cohnella silvisoli TaxID=2873699 RepID=A0ABV1KM40_9BACL|nr:carbohydrate ABC transporter permease [Cohnella silvisoli]MCD9020772.1 carbohydrate ABC transporter permease [Cohnella silvisoli]
MRRSRGIQMTAGTLLILLALVYLFPIYLILINSFKSFRDIFESPLSFPASFYLDNYTKAWKASDFLQTLLNNVTVTALTIAGVVVFTSMAGYKLSRDKSKLSWFFYILFTFPFLIPLYSYMIPLVQLVKQFHIENSPASLSLIYVSTSSFALFMFHGFVKSIPVELDESAYMDGCSQIRLFFSIVFPLLKPAISSVAILFSLWTWNDFLLPFLILTDKDAFTITIKVFQMFGMYGSEWDVITASLVLASMPIVILYVILQKYIVSGIAAGAIKG